MQSEQDIYSSSIEIESDFNMFDDEKVGGFLESFENDKSLNESLDKLKNVVITSTKLIANLIKMINQRKFYQSFNAEKKFLDNYNKVMGQILLNQQLSELDDKKKLKNIISLNSIALFELKDLIKKHDESLLKNNKISESISHLLKIIQ